MASKFQQSIKELRQKMATESADTIARLKKVESKLDTAVENLRSAVDTLRTEMKNGFEEMELALVAQTGRNMEHMDTLLEQVARLEEEHGQQLADLSKGQADHEARLKRLEDQGQPPAA